MQQIQPIAFRDAFAFILRLHIKSVFAYHFSVKYSFGREVDFLYHKAARYSNHATGIRCILYLHIYKITLSRTFSAQLLAKLYLRYVDVIFAVFPDDKSCTSFLDLLNSQHKNIEFAAEHAAETIPFLDVEIKLNDSGLDTWVSRKPTHTNLLLNFNAFCPLKWKSGLILRFLNRAKLICSNISLFEQEIEKLKTMFKANDYPGRFFDKILQQFLKSDKNQSSNSTQPSQSAYEYPISLPYLGKSFSKIRQAIFQNHQ